jgi:hypothetical protein
METNEFTVIPWRMPPAWLVTIATPDAQRRMALRSISPAVLGWLGIFIRIIVTQTARPWHTSWTNKDYTLNGFIVEHAHEVHMLHDEAHVSEPRKGMDQNFGNFMQSYSEPLTPALPPGR